QLSYSAFPAFPRLDAPAGTRAPYIDHVDTGWLANGYAHTQRYSLPEPTSNTPIMLRHHPTINFGTATIEGYTLNVTNKLDDNWEWSLGTNIYGDGVVPLGVKILCPSNDVVYNCPGNGLISISVLHNGVETDAYQSITYVLDGTTIYTGSEKEIWHYFSFGPHTLSVNVLGNDGRTYTRMANFRVRKHAPHLVPVFDGDPVDLDSGEETYQAQPDLTAFNAQGNSVAFARTFSSAFSKIGYATPGLSRGWVHNYDYRITTPSGSWGALMLTYPGGAVEDLTPELDGQGNPTGVINPPGGYAQVITGEPSTTPGVWNSITVEMRGHERWVFSLHTTGVYILTRIINPLGKELRVSWNTQRQLTELAQKNGDNTYTTLLSFSYETGADGYLTAVTDCHNRKVVYGYSLYHNDTYRCLTSVSKVVDVNETTPGARCEYDYAVLGHLPFAPLLNEATEKSPTGGADSTISFAYSPYGRVDSQTNAKGVVRSYTYHYNGTVDIVVKDSNNVEMTHWTQHIDADGHDIGITDVAGHRTLIEYTDTNNPDKPTRVTGKDGKTISYTYNQFGNVTSVTTE
ncbi:MAG TPA: hypothetical protein VGL77_07175, partial [Armatimonadota bacterium]